MAVDSAVNGVHTAHMVHKYLNVAYDNVKLVANNINNINEVAAAVINASNFAGTFSTEAALNLTVGKEGAFAYVDGGTGDLVTSYLWDHNNSVWVKATDENSIAAWYNINGYKDEDAIKLIDALPLVLAPVVFSTQENATLSGDGGLNINLPDGSRVLVRAQSNASENGVYLINSGAWSKTTDFTEGSRLFSGIQVVSIEEGNENIYILTYSGTYSAGVTELKFTPMRFI